MEDKKAANESGQPCPTEPQDAIINSDFANNNSGGGLPAPVPYVYPYAVRKPTQRQPFTADKNDGIFCIISFILGFIFVRWVSPWEGWGVTAFAFIFALAVGMYARAKRIKPSRESWYWLAIALLTGLSFSLWPGGWLALWRILLLGGAMVYWCACLFGVLLANKTGNFLPLDVLNLLFLLPLRNYDTTKKTLGFMLGAKDSRKRILHAMMPVLLGLLLCLPVLGLVLPLLASADAGIFGRFYYDFLAAIQSMSLWQILDSWGGTLALQFLLGIPVGLYLCWLVVGAAHKRYTKNVDPNVAQRNLAAMALVPKTSVLVLLAVVSAVYALFIACQVPYFFSGFAGAKPAEFTVYSEYAREGFFELCRIAAINLALLAAANGFCRSNPRESKALRGLNLLLSAMTLLVIATAFSKMWLYIAMQGFTPKRVATSVFMVFLAGVWVAAMVLQFRHFSIVRFAAVYGAGLLCALCLCNLDAQVVRYNAARYQAGSLPVFDELIVYRSGVAGAETSLEIYNAMGENTNAEAKLRLGFVLSTIRDQAKMEAGTPRDSLAKARARALNWPRQDSLQIQQGAALFYEYHDNVWLS